METDAEHGRWRDHRAQKRVSRSRESGPQQQFRPSSCLPSPSSLLYFSDPNSSRARIELSYSDEKSQMHSSLSRLEHTCIQSRLV